MRIRSVAFIAGAVTLSVGAPATAQATTDVKCLMASNLFSKAAKDPKARTVAEAAKYFYLGRISGRLNEQQIRAQMQAQAKTITKANAGNVMNSCIRQMQSGAAVIERVGKQLATPRK